MNTNDLPLAQKLAALMEAGRATHPNMRHIRGWGDGKNTGCAMMFAALGAGVDLNAPENKHRAPASSIAEAIGADESELTAMMRDVIRMNDEGRATLDEIIKAVRDDQFPEAASRRPNMIWLNEYASFSKTAMLEQLTAYQQELLAEATKGALPSYYWIGVDPAAPEKIVSGKVSDKQPRPEAVRKSAKTGATWPKPKHAYA